MNAKSYFAASNTERGFVSYFAENFRDRADRCYIIKGGPGTGKSRLMKEMATAAESVGGRVEYYYCSSDPTSLDGLYIEFGNDSIAVLDGTAPHAEDIISPGTVDNIIDLGRFWNAKLLRQHKPMLEVWGRKKKNAYAAAYRALSAYGSLTRMADALVEDCTNIQAIAEETAKIALSLPEEKEIRSPLSAVGMRGKVSFDTFRENAGLTLSVTDSRGYGVSYLYLDYLRQAVGACRTAPHPIMTGRCSGLLVGSFAAVEASLISAGDNVIDITDFVNREAYLEVKDRCERLRSIAKGTLEEAETSFREAGAAHMKIEEIFISTMDFEAKEAYSRELCTKIARGDL